MYHLAHLLNSKSALGLPTSLQCFDRHATEEMKTAFDMAGDYHKFILDRHFSHDIMVCFLKETVHKEHPSQRGEGVGPKSRHSKGGCMDLV